jgi:hypothetical protein
MFFQNANIHVPVRRADSLTTFMCWLSRNLGASTSWNPKGLYRPVMALLYLAFADIHIQDYVVSQLRTQQSGCKDWFTADSNSEITESSQSKGYSFIKRAVWRRLYTCMSVVSKVGIIFLHLANCSLSGRTGRHSFVSGRPQVHCHFSLWRPIPIHPAHSHNHAHQIQDVTCIILVTVVAS